MGDSLVEGAGGLDTGGLEGVGGFDDGDGFEGGVFFDARVESAQTPR